MNIIHECAMSIKMYDAQDKIMRYCKSFWKMKDVI